MKSTKTPPAVTAQSESPLLGGLTPQTFMRRHWQKKPLLIRQAVPDVTSPVDRATLFDMAGRDEVESRLILKAGDDWRLRHGPFTRRSLPKLSQAGWSLLVQGLDLHVPAARELLSQFRFVPDARLDDVMISYATDGGGVGPHYDSYDVFLLQVQGRRRWRIGRLRDDSLQPDVPLKILSHFEAEQEWVLEPGDMLYLPPRWAHDGVAEGECMTCSIGFRAPEAGELARELLCRLAELIDSGDRPKLYRDPEQAATERPGQVPASLQAFASEAVVRALRDPQLLQAALGEALTEPKPRVWFDAGEPLPEQMGVVLSPQTRMLYDERRIFANGESWVASGADAKLLRRLADVRTLTASEVARASEPARELLHQWAEDGWLRPLSMENQP